MTLNPETVGGRRSLSAAASLSTRFHKAIWVTGTKPLLSKRLDRRSSDELLERKKYVSQRFAIVVLCRLFPTTVLLSSKQRNLLYNKTQPLLFYIPFSKDPPTSSPRLLVIGCFTLSLTQAEELNNKSIEVLLLRYIIHNQIYISAPPPIKLINTLYQGQHH